MRYTIKSGPTKYIKVNEKDYRDYYCIKKEKVDLVYLFKRDKQYVSLEKIIEILGLKDYSVKETEGSYIILKQ